MSEKEYEDFVDKKPSNLADSEFKLDKEEGSKEDEENEMGDRNEEPNFGILNKNKKSMDETAQVFTKPQQMSKTRKRKKNDARLCLLDLLDEYEEVGNEFDKKNEAHELSPEEKSLEELVFPETLLFPIHKNFRIFLTTFPVDYFPATFARKCKKITLELPGAIRLNTMKTLNAVTTE